MCLVWKERLFAIWCAILLGGCSLHYMDEKGRSHHYGAITYTRTPLANGFRLDLYSCCLSFQALDDGNAFTLGAFKREYYFPALHPLTDGEHISQPCWLALSGAPQSSPNVARPQTGWFGLSLDAPTYTRTQLQSLGLSVKTGQYRDVSLGYQSVSQWGAGRLDHAMDTYIETDNNTTHVIRCMWDDNKGTKDEKHIAIAH